MSCPSWSAADGRDTYQHEPVAVIISGANMFQELTKDTPELLLVDILLVLYLSYRSPVAFMKCDDQAVVQDVPSRVSYLECTRPQSAEF